MQPQDQNGPSGQYDFIMNSGGKPKHSLMPSLNLGLPKPAKISLAIILGLMVLVIIGALLAGGGKGGNQPIVNLMAQAQEISRVSALAASDSQDSNLQALAATVGTIADSQQAQLNDYLTSSGQKVNPKSLLADQSSATDAAFQTASQNNNLPAAFNDYLKTTLASYQSQLSSEYGKTSSTSLKSILNDAYNSIRTLLGSLSQTSS